MKEKANAPIRKEANTRQAANTPRDEAGLEPQIAKGGASKSGKYQTDVVRSVMRTDRQPRQRLQLTYFECLQIIGTTQDSQNIEVIQSDDDQDCSLYQPPTCGQQGKHSVDRLEDNVKSGDQGNIDSEDGEIAGDAKAKEPFVLHNVQRSLRGIVEDD